MGLICVHLRALCLCHVCTHALNWSPPPLAHASHPQVSRPLLSGPDAAPATRGLLARALNTLALGLSAAPHASRQGLRLQLMLLFSAVASRCAPGGGGCAADLGALLPAVAAAVEGLQPRTLQLLGGSSVRMSIHDIQAGVSIGVGFAGLGRGPMRPAMCGEGYGWFSWLVFQALHIVTCRRRHTRAERRPVPLPHSPPRPPPQAAQREDASTTRLFRNLWLHAALHALVDPSLPVDPANPASSFAGFGAEASGGLGLAFDPEWYGAAGRVAGVTPLLVVGTDSYLEADMVERLKVCRRMRRGRRGGAQGQGGRGARTKPRVQRGGERNAAHAAGRKAPAQPPPAAAQCCGPPTAAPQVELGEQLALAGRLAERGNIANRLSR